MISTTVCEVADPKSEYAVTFAAGFRDEESLGKAMAAEATKELVADAANYTDATAVFLVGNVVA